MSVYKTVLIAVDIDGGAGVVLERALALFDTGDVSIIVLNVVDLPFPIYNSAIAGGLYAPVGLGVDEETVKENRQKALSDLVNKTSSKTLQTTVECGRPVPTILDVAKREDADVIVIGSHGKYGVALLLGSTANGVLHRANSDVLAVAIGDKNTSP